MKARRARRRPPLPLCGNGGRKPRGAHACRAELVTIQNTTNDYWLNNFHRRDPCNSNAAASYDSQCHNGRASRLLLWSRYWSCNGRHWHCRFVAARHNRRGCRTGSLRRSKTNTLIQEIPLICSRLLPLCGDARKRTGSQAAEGPGSPAMCAPHMRDAGCRGAAAPGRPGRQSLRDPSAGRGTSR